MANVVVCAAACWAADTCSATFGSGREFALSQGRLSMVLSMNSRGPEQSQPETVPRIPV